MIAWHHPYIVLAAARDRSYRREPFACSGVLIRRTGERNITGDYETAKRAGFFDDPRKVAFEFVAKGRVEVPYVTPSTEPEMDVGEMSEDYPSGHRTP
jgi:hypothetical protein